MSAVQRTLLHRIIRRTHASFPGAGGIGRFSLQPVFANDPDPHALFRDSATGKEVGP